MSAGERGRRAAFDRGAFFRLCRMLHAYLSTLAFAALLFFSVTGLLLNHPEWFEAYRPAEHDATVTVSPAAVRAALAAPEPGKAIAAAVRTQIPLAGDFSSADRQGEQMLVRLEGPKGSADLDVDLGSGRVQIRATQAGLTSILLDLHRGKNSGVAWRGLIDVTAIVVALSALIGLALVFSLRLRLKTNLALTGLGLLVLIGVAIWMVH